MRTWAAILLLLLCACPVWPAPPAVVGVDTLLRAETDLSQLPRLRDWTVGLQSSYDRTGGNADYQNFPAMGGKTAVLADLRGPGAVVRLWSPNPSGRLKITVDDAPAPVIDTPLAALFDGSLPAFAPPLTQASSGGFYSYLPIPYAKRCRITVDGPQGLYYQVNFVSFAPGTLVRPFALPLTPPDQAALQAAAAVWSHPERALADAAVRYHPRKVLLAAGRTQTVAELRGPGVVRSLALAAPLGADLRRLALRGYFDGHTAPDVEAPVADFFGCGYGRRAFASLLLSQSAAGAMEARFPMPFARSARFTLENRAGRALGIVWNIGLVQQPFRLQEEGYFHARWSRGSTKRGLPHVWAKVQGQRGHFVGIVQTMAGRGLGFLEGDEQFRTDAQTWGKSKFAATVIGPWNGTGTEDFFNSGWYFDKGPNALPLNGALVRDQVGKLGRISAYRWLLNDAPTFQSSLDAQIEHGGVNDAPNSDYSSVAYWYASGPVQGGPQTPPAAQITPPHSPVPLPSLTLKDPLEGEALVSSAVVTGGKVQTQDLSAYDDVWSGDSQLFWTGGKAGDTLTLTLPARPGAFNVTGYFTRAADYGQVTLTLNGQPLGGVFDGYHAGVAASGPVRLGRVTLPGSPARLVVTLRGKNAAATNTLFGLDALTLTPTK